MTSEANETPRGRRWLPRLGRWLIAAVLLYLLASNIWTQVIADEATEETAAVQEKAEDAAVTVDRMCSESGQLADELERRGACKDAREVLDLPQPERVPGPSREDIAAAVEDYLRDNPPPRGRPPTVGEITSVVAEFLTAHPPRPGRAPTPAEIATATADYLRANPPADGRDGRDGDPAPPPTAEQIAAAVNAYLEEHPPPAGPQGPPGPACPEGYAVRQVVAVAPDGGTYTDALACVRPESSRAPEPPGLLPGS